MKSVVVNWRSYHDHVVHGEDTGVNPIGSVNTSPSETIPGQELSIEELIRRYVRGDRSRTFAGVYNDDPTFPDNIENMDELEKLDLLKQTRERVSGIQASMQQAAKQRSKVENPPPLPPTPDKVEGKEVD